MENKLIFTKQDFHSGVVDKKGLAEWRFYFNEGVDTDIEYIHLGCSCTKLTKITDKYIEGTVNVQMSGYDTDSRLMVKSITVCLNDGLNEYIPDAKKKRIINPRKKRETLTIRANVLT